jgi:hypothetical protein
VSKANLEIGARRSRQEGPLEKAPPVILQLLRPLARGSADQIGVHRRQAREEDSSVSNAVMRLQGLKPMFRMHPE